MDYHIVIAKYKEDISWLQKMNKSHIYLYDKGFEDISGNEFAHYEQRENIGREGETYLYHIVKHYDNLPDYLIFLQGNPFDHFYTQEKMKPEYLQQQIENAVNEKIIETAPMFSKYGIELNYTWPGLKVPEYYEYIFQGSIEFSTFSPGCQYFLPKSKILCRPKAFWEKAHKMLENGKFYEGVEVTINSSHEKNVPFYKTGMNPWIFERLAAYFFNEIPMNPAFLKD